MKCVREAVTYVCGYHVYRAIWDTATGYELVCETEPSNEHDQ